MAVIIQLQRAGDIINVLPLALCLSKQIGRVSWVVSADHASILDGASYVNAIPWDGDQTTLHAAVRHYQSAQPIVTQAYLNPDRRWLTESFALEQWRHAGLLDQFGAWPLVFDQPNPARANMLRDRVLSNRHRGRPLVLCATTSISTPYPHANRLIASIRGLDADVIDLNDVRAERIYDLIALYDAADCLVTVDTAHLHLARAAKCPVVALINDGWKGAVPPPQTVAHWRYAELGDDLSPVVKAVSEVISRKAESIAMVFHTYPPGHTDRHRRAMATHPKDAVYATFDHRPKCTALLMKGLESGKDVCAFTNDDVSIPAGSLDKIRAHAAKWDFGCSRRPRTPVHIGREIFWFKSDWLKKNWGNVPSCYWTVQKPDLILAKWMRKMRGIETTYENLNFDMSPVELPAGIIEHEDHESHWDCDAVTKSPEGLHNEKLWAEMA